MKKGHKLELFALFVLAGVILGGNAWAAESTDAYKVRCMLSAEDPLHPDTGTIELLSAAGNNVISRVEFKFEKNTPGAYLPEDFTIVRCPKTAANLWKVPEKRISL